MMSELLARFEGDTGKPRLIEVLKRQNIVQGDEDVAVALAERAELMEFEEDDVIITQGDTDNDVYFILMGSVTIKVNGRAIATRKAGQHVGEMVLIDPSATRSADVVSDGDTVLAKVDEPFFSSLAANHSHLWRNFAVQLCERLRERNNHVSTPNIAPRVFIGSSKEGLAVAREIQAGLDHDDFTLTVWTDGVFGASTFPIDDLLNKIRSSDFAILVISADDKILSREEEQDAPRDNVIFELGLSMGALSRERTVIVSPRGKDIKIPSDLLGLNSMDYKSEPTSDIQSNIGSVCTKLRTLIKEFGVK